VNEYDKWEAEARRRGWKLPVETTLPRESWVQYWKACDNYERRRAAGEPDPGRPVAPHRSASTA